jgi:hypothetical protein
MRFVITILFLSITTISVAGGPWLTPKKTGFFQVQTTLPFGAYNQLFLANNTGLNLNREVLDINLQAYLEYGITDKINLITSLPLKYISTGNTQEPLTNPILLQEGDLIGLSNIKLGLKYRVSDKKMKVALSIQSSFNTTNRKLEKGLATGYQSNTIGTYAHIGKSFSKGKIYSFLEGGINIASNDFSNFYEVHYEFGYQISSPFWGVFTVDIRESLRDGNYRNSNLRQTGFYTNNQEYLAYGFKFAYEFKNKIGLTAATFGALSGNYVAKIGTASLGIYKKW